MVKRLGGVLLGFGANRAGEFCTSYNVWMGVMCARGLPTLTHPRTILSWYRFVKFKQVA
jgi:hypothetical protein